MLSYELYKNVILEAIGKIENSLKGITIEEFLKNSEMQDSTLMRLQVIGENIKEIPTNVKKKEKEIKWKKFERLRNVISHKYNSIDYHLIWDFLNNNLNELKQVLVKI